jgi:hypothetical protein
MRVRAKELNKARKKKEDAYKERQKAEQPQGAQKKK